MVDQTPLVIAYADCETTGLNRGLHMAFEVSVWREDRPEPVTLIPPHTLAGADPEALRIGRYFERDFRPGEHDDEVDFRLARLFLGTVLVAANARFDADFVSKVVGYEPWHYRLLDIEAFALGVIGRRMGWRTPKGMKDIAEALRSEGFDVPMPDHTAEGDVRALRAAHEALLVIDEQRG